MADRQGENTLMSEAARRLRRHPSPNPSSFSGFCLSNPPGQSEGRPLFRPNGEPFPPVNVSFPRAPLRGEAVENARAGGPPVRSGVHRTNARTGGPAWRES